MKKGLDKKFLAAVFCCFLFLAVFLFLPTVKVSADLEVNYPIITDVTGAKLGVNTETDLPNYLKYVFNIGIFVGFFAVFLSLAWAGALYFLSPAIPGALADAKDRVGGAISGLLILALLYLIITTINPQLAIFKLNKLEPAQSPQPDLKTPAGVYFYNKEDCSENPTAQISSMPDLGDLKNRINSINVVQHPNEGTFYISVLYDLINFSGKCQYINPCQDNSCQQSGCQKVEPFADSASIYQYDQSPNGDGVYFYRKSYFNSDGGWQKIDNSEIKNAKIYIKKLEQLTYNKNPSSDSPDGCTVPKEEQECAMWDADGNCTQKKCPNLAADNITSIKIKGNYFVLLVYFDETKDQSNGPWTFCQAFPTKDDVAKNGPNQIKWEGIRNLTAGQFPNYVAIIPVKQK